MGHGIIKPAQGCFTHQRTFHCFITTTVQMLIRDQLFVKYNWSLGVRIDHFTVFTTLIRASNLQRVHNVDQHSIRLFKFIRTNRTFSSQLCTLSTVHWVFTIFTIMRIIYKTKANNAFKITLLLFMIHNSLGVYEFSFIVILKLNQLLYYLFLEKFCLI